MVDLSKGFVVKRLNDRKFIEFINRIGNFNILTGPWIAGGSVRKAWQGLEWDNQDVDIFFKDQQQLEEFKHNLAKLAKNKLDLDILDRSSHINEYNGYLNEAYNTTSSSDNLWDFELVSSPHPQLKPTLSRDEMRVDVFFKTSNAVTFDVTFSDQKKQEKKIRLQVINRRMNESFIDLVQDFDFTVCQFVTDGKDMYASVEAVEDSDNGVLRQIANTVREITPIRIAKYIAYGFLPDDKEFSELVDKLAENGSLGEQDDY